MNEYAQRDITAACKSLKAGGVIAYPTEGVFGLGCDPANEHAIDKLLSLKNRDIAKGFILIASNREQGDTTSGVTIMQMDKGLDTGDMLYKVSCEIGVDTTGIELHDQLAAVGSEALLKTLTQLHEGTLHPEVQDDAASCYAAKIEKSEATLDWKLPASALHRKVCAFNAWPVAQTVLEGETIRVWESSLVKDESADSVSVECRPAGQVVGAVNHLDVATGEGVLRIHKLQPPGKKAMPVSDFLNSRKIAVGTQLG